MINFTKRLKYHDIIGLIQREFGEIGNLLIEDSYISFEVYRSYYEDTPRFLQTPDGQLRLKLVGKFDDPFFTLCYAIT